MKQLALPVALLLCLPVTLPSAAAEANMIYFSPAGTGLENGRSPSNSYGIEFLQSELNHAEVFTRFVFLSGDYVLDKSIKLQPVGTGRLELEGRGARFKPLDGVAPFSLFIVERGDWSLKGVAASGFDTFIRVADGSTSSDVSVENVAVSNVASGISISGENLAAQRWTIRNINITAYLEFGIRLSGAGVSNIGISGLNLDGQLGPEQTADCYKGGVQIHAGAHDIQLTDFVIANNVSTCGNYPQGDGIEVDDSEGAPYNIHISRGILFGNRDGDLDLKAQSVYISNIDASDNNQRYSLRTWNYSYSCNSCKFGSGNVADFFVNRGDVLYISDDITELRLHCAGDQDPPNEGQVVLQQGNRVIGQEKCRNVDEIIVLRGDGTQ